MAQISMQQVKELRDRTQAGLNDCKTALTEAEGDTERAVELILKRGLAKSAKRAGAVATEGEVAARVLQEGRSAVIAEVNVQTDFAARSDDFKKFVAAVMKVAETAAPGADLTSQPFPGGDGTIEDHRKNLVARIGENVTVRRWQRLSVQGVGLAHAYVHMGGKIGAILTLETGSQDVARSDAVKKLADDTAMQIAAMTPLYLSREQVPEEAKQKQCDIFDAQLAEEGKPEAARPKIVQGKLSKWMKEVCLLEQDSVLEADKTVDQVRAEAAKVANGDVKIVAFVRYALGEGIEKPQGPDFAEEARAMAGG